jgi:hypothetical protein
VWVLVCVGEFEDGEVEAIVLCGRRGGLDCVLEVLWDLAVDMYRYNLVRLDGCVCVISRHSRCQSMPLIDFGMPSSWWRMRPAVRLCCFDIQTRLMTRAGVTLLTHMHTAKDLSRAWVTNRRQARLRTQCWV